MVEEAFPAGGPLQEVVDVALEGVPHALLVVVDLPEVKTAAALLLQYLGICNVKYGHAAWEPIIFHKFPHIHHQRREGKV